METIYRDYSTKGVRFFYIYKALAHPETNGYITPFSQVPRTVRDAQLEELKEGDGILVELSRPTGGGEPVIARIVARRF